MGLIIFAMILHIINALRSHDVENAWFDANGMALADACVGWMRGGMAMVNIVASYFFGGISGSASADTASIGSIMIPMMVDQGYDADFSTAVTITSSCEGLLVPPSHNMVIYATTAGGISVGSLFLAGYLPGALLAIVLMVGSYIISVKENYPKGSPFTIKGFIYYRGCWHGVSRCFFFGYLQYATRSVLYLSLIHI